MIYNIVEKQMVVETNVYEVEARNSEEALDLYCEKLAGSIGAKNTYYESCPADFKESINVELGDG